MAKSWHLSISTDDVRKRAEVSKLAPHDIDRAVQVARSIQHPWYRCQALAYAADVHPNRRVTRLLVDEAFRVAEEQDEINRIVTVSAWPLGVCAKAAPERALERLVQLIDIAEKEEHSLRRGDALFALANVVAEHAALKAQVVPPLVRTLTSGRGGWRIEQLIVDTAMLVRKDFPEHIPALLEAHSENRRKRKLVEALSGA